MLGSVLLHVVKTAIPIYFSVDWAGGYLGRRVMYHFARSAWIGRHHRRNGNVGNRVHDFEHFYVPERSDIVRLPARSGIKSGAVKDHFPALAFALAGNDVGVKFPQEGIVIVNPLSQRSSLS